MPRVMPEPRDGITRAGWKIVLLASLGGTLEFYDFVVFGVFARDIAEAIFPNTTPIVSLMASFGAFAAGYLARPIGGIVLSHFGDRYGRRTVFLLSLFVMSAATLGMGLVPSYASWGVWASLTMVTLRLVQGFCIGGELPGALTYVVETAPRHAPFVCGLVFACVTMGVAVASGVSLGVRTWLPPELVPIYGWRIAFVLGGLAGLLSFLMRRAMEESPEFARMKALASKRPFGEVLQTHRGAVLAGIGGLAATGGFNGLFFALMPAYLSGVLQYGARDAVIAQTVGVVVHAAAILGVGRLADRLSPRLMIGARRRRLLICWPSRSTTRWPSRADRPGAGDGAGGAGRRPGQRHLRGAADRPVPDADPLHRAWRWSSTSRSRCSAAPRRWWRRRSSARPACRRRRRW